MKAIQDFKMQIVCDIYNSQSGQKEKVYFDVLQFVADYRIHGGPEQPIRYILLELNKPNADTVKGKKYSDNTLVETDYTLIDNIIQGESKLVVDAVGMGTFIITKVELKDYLYQITAYGVEVILNSMILSSPITGTTSQVVTTLVSEWFDTVLGSNNYNIQFSNTFTTPVSFNPGMSYLNMIQVCALIENAFVFFSDKDSKDTFYFVRYEDTTSIATNPNSYYVDGGFRNGEAMDGMLNVYPGMDDPHENYSPTDYLMYTHAVALNSQTSEGADTIVNAQTVQVLNAMGEYVSVYNDDGADGSSDYTGAGYSIRMYGEYGGTVLQLPHLQGATEGGSDNLALNAKRIANNLVRRYRDPSQTLVVMMAETRRGEVDGTTVTAWERTFEPFAFAKYINDDVNKINLSYYHPSDKDINPTQSKDNSFTRISTITYCYPEIASQYKFGVAKQADLTQTIATLVKSTNNS